MPKLELCINICWHFWWILFTQTDNKTGHRKNRIPIRRVYNTVHHAHLYARPLVRDISRILNPIQSETSLPLTKRYICCQSFCACIQEWNQITYQYMYVETPWKRKKCKERERKRTQNTLDSTVDYESLLLSIHRKQ